MAGQRQPVDLLIAKGKKHLTKAEIEERQRTEVRAAADKVTAPKYLTASQKRTFKKIVKELRAIKLVANLDVDALARLIISQEKYVEVTQEIDKQPLMIEEFYTKKDADGKEEIKSKMVVNREVERLTILQNKYFKQCRQGASDFGMTVSSRCRLVAPTQNENSKENKFSKFA